MSELADIDREFMTVAEAAVRARCSAPTIYNAIQHERLVAVKFGRSYRIAPEDLRAFVVNGGNR